jgi:hypothetical protein
VKGFRSSGERQERNRGVAATWASSSSSSKIATILTEGELLPGLPSALQVRYQPILTEGEQLPGIPPALQVR